MSPQTVEVLAVGEALVLADPLTAGPLEHVEGFVVRVAGAEMNALIGLSRLGHTSALLTAVGDDPFGRRIVATLDREGVETRFIERGAGPTGMFFKERIGGHGRRVYYYRTGSAASTYSPESAIAAMREADPRIVLASGLTLGVGGPSGLGGAAARVIQEGRRSGATVVFDANLRPGIWYGRGAADTFNDLAPHVCHLLAGLEEISELTGTDPDTAARQLLDRGIEAVVVKMGAAGSVVYSREGRTPIAPIPAEPVDSIGAGDAFAAGYVSGLLRGWAPARAARLGSVLGARAVSSTGDWEALPRGLDAQRIVASILDDRSQAGETDHADEAARA